MKLKKALILWTKKSFLIPGIFVMSFISLEAQKSQDYFFQSLTTFNGLSSNYIQCILKDSRGFIWIGTNNGLNRYDGRNIKVYHHNPGDPNSLPSEFIQQIKEDQDGILWMRGGGGLIEFNPFTEKFNYHQHDPANPKSPAGKEVNPFIDSKNNLWVTTENGLQLFNRSKNIFKSFPLSPPDSVRKNPRSGAAWAMAEDKEHNIWCSGAKGLYKFDKVRRQMVLFPFQNKSFSSAMDLFVDHKGNFWVAFWSGGINLFHPENGKFDPIPSFSRDRFSAYGKMSEWRDPDGVYWLTICTTRGLLLYNVKTGEKKIIRNNPDNPHSLIYNDLYFVYTDNDNILWIGTKKGLNMLNNSDQAFNVRTIVQGNSDKDREVMGAIETIYEDCDIKMVTFMWTKGLGVYDAHWNLVRFYPNISPSDTSLEAKNVFGIYKDFRGVYWISTGNALVRFDRKKNLFKTFRPAADESGTQKGPMLLREIIPFDSTSFYIRSRNLGIYKFDVVKSKFTGHLYHDDKDPGSLPGNFLKAVVRDSGNRLIILSGNNGIYIYDPGRNRYENYTDHPDPAIREALNNLCSDPGLSGNILWMNSAQGLLKFDLFTKRFDLFNSQNGLANDYLISNEADDKGNVWVAHNGGISMFDTSNHTFINYGENDGLDFQELNYNMKKMADGNIYIGDRDRLVYFDPTLLGVNQKIPQVFIRSVKVLNEPFSLNPDSATGNKMLTLKYDQDFITVDFSVLNYSHPQKNRFYFRLDNDTVWHEVNDGMVNLVKLSPGKYQLHVTGSNDSGIMNPTGDTLYIRILPPYYGTWWFRAAMILGLLSAMYLIQRYRVQRIKHGEQVKTEFNKMLAQAETKALRAQMNPHFIFNSLNSINSFVMDKKHELASDYLIKFSKLIRLILENSRSETIPIEKEIETLQLYVLLESARFDNQFKSVFIIADNVVANSIMIPPMLLQPYIENAIWHGLMQKEGEGTITVEIKKEREECLHISISDDGIGRERALALKSKSASHKSHGLKVTSERIEVMNRLHSTGAQVRIIDLKDDHGLASGTRVELIIPF